MLKMYVINVFFPLTPPPPPVPLKEYVLYTWIMDDPFKVYNSHYNIGG